MENILLQILITIGVLIISVIITAIILPNPNKVKYIPNPPQIYKVGDYIAVKRGGSNEIISGKIKEIYKDLFWGYDLAILETDKGERLITSETDSFRNGY